MKKLGIIVAALFLITIIAALFTRAFFLSFVDNYEFGFTYNKVSGKITPLERTGYFLYPPWFYSVHAIDTRPIQIQITGNTADGRTMNSSIGQRVLNAKLVRFNPAGLETFVSWHGRDAGDSRHNLAEILRVYAFDREGGRTCPFLIVDSELAPSQGSSTNDLR